MIRAIALINMKVLLKYQKGLKPHWQRIGIWKKSLRIADEYEKKDLLYNKKVGFFQYDKSFIKFRVYDTPYSFGALVLLEKPYQILSDNDARGNNFTFPKVPPFVKEDVISRAEARILISEFIIQDTNISS